MPATTAWLTPWGNADNVSIKVDIDPSMIQGQRGVFGPGLLIYFKTTPVAHPPVEIVLHSLEGWITWGAESNFAPGIRIPSQIVDVNTTYLLEGVLQTPREDPQSRLAIVPA
jgi:hypothetical protein